MTDNNNQKERWHVTKEVNVAHIIMLIVTLTAALGSAFALLSKIDHNTLSIQYVTKLHDANKNLIHELRTETDNKFLLLHKEYREDLRRLQDNSLHRIPAIEYYE